jgi:orotidine-5'-phosphate decarboxylase
MSLIAAKRSIVVACDVPSIGELEKLVADTSTVPGIGAYKVGLQLAIRYGLTHVLAVTRSFTKLPVIYDHQKGGTDIPEMGARFAEACKEAGVDAVILFPLAGPESQLAWLDACNRLDLRVLIGLHMTHKAFLVSEGGFVDDTAPRRVFELAADHGVTDYVVPGNKVAAMVEYKRLLEAKRVSYTFYAPGFITQGGDITECGRAAGDRWHAIVGSAVYLAPSPRQAAERLTRQML